MLTSRPTVLLAALLLPLTACGGGDDDAQAAKAISDSIMESQEGQASGNAQMFAMPREDALIQVKRHERRSKDAVPEPVAVAAPLLPVNGVTTVAENDADARRSALPLHGPALDRDLPRVLPAHGGEPRHRLSLDRSPDRSRQVVLEESRSESPVGSRPGRRFGPTSAAYRRGPELESRGRPCDRIISSASSASPVSSTDHPTPSAARRATRPIRRRSGRCPPGPSRTTGW